MAEGLLGILLAGIAATETRTTEGDPSTVVVKGQHQLAAQLIWGIIALVTRKVEPHGQTGLPGVDASAKVVQSRFDLGPGQIDAVGRVDLVHDFLGDDGQVTVKQVAQAKVGGQLSEPRRISRSILLDLLPTAGLPNHGTGHDLVDQLVPEHWTVEQFNGCGVILQLLFLKG